MKKLTKVLTLVAIVISSSFLLSACNKKTTTDNSSKTAQKTSTKKQIELSADEKPYVSLIPRSDGHNLTFKVSGIPSKFTAAEYELIYTAKDENIEIEKGVSGTVELTKQNIEKDLLLGTASCTNGCKYKYDEGINGGTLTLTLFTNDKDYVNYETQFVLKTGGEINKEKKLTLTQDNFTINGTTTSKSEYFVAIKNFKSVYSVFSSSSGKGKITSIEPSTVAKNDLNTLTGDYTPNQ